MAVLRIERSGDVVNDAYLWDGRLSLKSKGLLSLLLSLPDDRDYTMQGVSALIQTDINEIRSALRELNRVGYIQRIDERTESGRLREDAFAVFDRPHTPTMTDRRHSNGKSIST